MVYGLPVRGLDGQSNLAEGAGISLDSARLLTREYLTSRGMICNLFFERHCIVSEVLGDGSSMTLITAVTIE